MKHHFSLLILLFLLFSVQAQQVKKYNHILITNDDGAEDADRLLALARNVIQVADRVSIIVSSFDRSGTSNYTTYGKHQSTLEIKSRYIDKEENIAVYTTSGNPADCVLIGLNGLFEKDKPDLVLSGINSGPNIGPGWFGSGTIGAIRTAAFLGVRGIALSGFDDDDKRSFEVIPKWITQFIASDVIEDIDKNSYLTIGFPEVPLDSIKGVKVANRRASFDYPESIAFYKVVGNDPHHPENTTVWTSKYVGKLNEPTEEKYEDSILKEGFIVITPMSMDENNALLKLTFQEKFSQIPQFSMK